MLRGEGLVKTYRGPSAPIPVLSGVDVRVEAGALVVVAGTSGSGKSTLLNVLGLLEDQRDQVARADQRGQRSEPAGGHVDVPAQDRILHRARALERHVGDVDAEGLLEQLHGEEGHGAQAG
jgi:ABC-type nitrate/sulfonate/bicarbonate transport system ATPase subunit